jgi:uncharacterized protein YraI
MELLAFIECAVEFESPDSDRKLRTLDELGLNLPASTWVGLASVAIAVSILTNTPRADAAIHRGSTGDRVTHIQQALTQKGFNPGGIDGVFGGATEYAVIKFQRNHSLSADGVVGTETSKALFGGSTSGSGSSGSGQLMVKTSGTPLNVRSGPGTGYSVISSLPNGSAFGTTGRYSGGWVQRSAGGWVSTTYTSAGSGASSSSGASSGSGSSSPATLVVSTSGNPLNIRSGPGTGYSVIGSLANGTTVTLASRSGNWIHIVSGGWVSGDYLKGNM